MASSTRLSSLFVIVFVVFQFLLLSASAADCSKTNLCKIGCCSKDGFCGTTSAHCGTGCLSTCDYKPPATECSATKLCATGCCSKDGFCGTTEEHCGKGCQSTCDFKLGCDKKNPCKDGTCCSKFGFCGFGPDYCSKDNCVTGCDAKTFCDPGGYGPEFSEHSKCPLNVCCSKWGYCGLTEEFCGKKKVERPSCSVNNQPLRRVVGYYEGWATGRSCNRFKPSDIPDGVYTHINFAFASIDPKSFKIVPSAKGDPDLYRQLTQKKLNDPNLKVFIAIGGWTFNDPGPTATTFSDIARSEANQRTFIVSLISFINTYNFDGVDIDWEYPEAPDRQGRGEDFANLPKFLNNIKAALRQNGAKNGLSIAIPASYWYLQHFDIVKIAKYVDYFNVMTYDFHGSWDTPESWLGNHLNSHTNLTEIADGLDLLWRNNIRPDQVNLGLAFYSRTFTVSNPGCMSPGCLFDSGGPKGACSNAVGVLSNAEISSMSSSKAVHVELDKKAAVKILKSGREWMTFDDGDTWKLKLDFARSQCLGGAMVWAISQDTADAKFSRQLQAVTGYKSRAVVTNIVRVELPGGVFIDKPINDASTDITKEQCRWTNCGEACPSGWQPVKRYDSTRNHIGERMKDSTGCIRSGSRTLCCPPGDQPYCQWLTFNNGRCKSGCPDGSGFEIASSLTDCNNGISQVACCRGDTPAMDAYRKCRWEGKEPRCAPDKGSPGCKTTAQYGYNSLTAWGPFGSGNQICADDQGKRGDRAYCCDTSDEADPKWTNCEWNDDFRSTKDGVPGLKLCYGDCPGKKIKLTLKRNSYNAPVCVESTQALCCDSRVTKSIETREEDYREALESWVKNPTCPNPDKTLSPRQATPVEGSDKATRIRREWSRPSEEVVSDMIEVIVENPSNSKLLHNVEEVWDNNVLARWEALGANAIASFWYPLIDYFKGVKKSGRLIAAAMECNMDSWDEELKIKTMVDAIHCPLPALAGVEPSLLQNPDESMFDEESTTVAMPIQELGLGLDILDWLNLEEERTGPERGFKVKCSRQGDDNFRIISKKYINGDQGDALAKANGDNNRWYVDNQLGNCFGFGIAHDGGRDSDDWVSEHILELSTIRNFIEFTTRGEIAARRGSKYSPDLPPVGNNGRLASCDMWKEKFRYGFEAWKDQRIYVTPMEYLFEELGSETNTEHMVNCERKLNSMKERVWNLKDPVSVRNWDRTCAKIDKRSAEKAIAALQLVYGVWQYLNAEDIQTKLINTHLAVVKFLTRFEESYRAQYKGPILDLPNVHWREYMTFHFGRMLHRSREWVEGRLGQLRSDWGDHLKQATRKAQTNPNPTIANDIVVAREIITALDMLDKSFISTFTFDEHLFLEAD